MPTIDAVLQRSAACAPDQIAVHQWKEGRRITYRELNDAVSCFAGWVRSQGLADGDAIAIHLPSSIDFLIAQFGSARAAGVAAYVNFRLSIEEAKRQFKLCKARVIVTTADKVDEFRSDSAFADVIFLSDGPVRSGCASLPEIMKITPHGLPDNAGREDCDAIIRFTSGSTGSPKGVIVTHRAWLIRAMCMLSEELKIARFSNTLLLGQLSHQAGLFVIPAFIQCSTLVMLSKFEVADVSAILKRESISCAQIVPTMFGLLLNDAAAREALKNSGLKTIVYGGSPFQQKLLEDALQLLAQTEFVQGYGSHEAGAISYLDGASHHDRALRLSAGRPFLCAEVRVRANAGENIGEVEVKAPWMPRARLTENGREPIAEEWVATGDVGEIVDGYIFLRDRMNDVIVSGGFNVYPKEVENVICSQDEVLDCAVVSAPDETWGERVIAFVVPRDPQRFDHEALRSHCRKLLANYKVPKEFRVIGEIPLNATGKPNRRQLSEAMWSGYARRIN